jgi:DNA (cytosine-5)-methyltransferase 3A
MTEPKFDLDVVLSLFDGISCGQEALRKAGISTRIYLASEIEKYPKQITRKNHPLTVQLGDVTKVVADDLPHVNLLMGGSPCQGFSFAGKQLNFDDPRSALFFEFVRLLRECKPDYFLLENVMMKQEYQDVITEHLGVEPVMINSSLVSAQNRKRLYWTNIPEVKQPEDKGILLKDVLEDEVDETCLHTTKAKTYMDRKVSGGRNHWDFKHHSDTDNDKSAAVVANFHKGVPYNVLIDREPKICGRIVGRKINPETGKRDDYNPELKRKKRIEARLDEKSGTLTTVQTDNVLIVPEATKKGYTEIKDGDCFDATFINSKTRRGRNMKDKSNCLTAANYDYMRYEHPTYRKLTPIECERLQTLPDNYTEGVSNTQRYKALGNGWTVDVIVHILQGLKQQTKVVAA